MTLRHVRLTKNIRAALFWYWSLSIVAPCKPRAILPPSVFWDPCVLEYDADGIRTGLLILGIRPVLITQSSSLSRLSSRSAVLRAYSACPSSNTVSSEDRQVHMNLKVGELLSRAESLAVQLNQGGRRNYVDEAIAVDREAMELCPPGYPKRTGSLSSLSVHLGDRHGRVRTMVDLAVQLYDWYWELGMVEDLDEAIVLDREALELCPIGHPDRSLSLNNLAICLFDRYKRLGTMENLNEAISLNRAALELRPLSHTEQLLSLNNLANCLYEQYQQLGTMKYLNEAIVFDQEALALCPIGHKNRSLLLNTLAVCFSDRYEQLGTVEDLNEAIVLIRETLALCPVGHPNRSFSLNNLAVCLFDRHKQLDIIEDLNEAIVLNREALALCLAGHPDRPLSLNSLAGFLFARFKQLGTMEDLNEAIALGRDALALCPVGHPIRSSSMNNLANCLLNRYKQLNTMGDLNEATDLNREALALRPVGHPNRSSSLINLASCLSNLYDQTGAIKDLNEVIVLCKDALELLPLGHTDRSEALESLAGYLHTRFTQLNQLEDKDAMFSLYSSLADVSQMASSKDLSATRAWIRVAEHYQHPTTLPAYETSIRLLVHHLATLPSLPQYLTIFKAHTSSLAVDAFSACLRNHSPTSAVELLEQGRGVFLNQLTRLRSPLDDVIASGPAGKALADEFMRLTLLIRKALNSPGVGQLDRACDLNLELKSVVTNIRKLSGFSRFLFPSLFPDLRRAACEGPVIIVNASKYTCDALIVLADHDPVHIPLSITRNDVRELSSKLNTLTIRARSMDVRRDLGVTLRELWDKVVSPIVDILLTTRPRQSRIWWCPTADFSPLPLHAAGPYRKGQENLADLYISSYTPTLTALIYARRHNQLQSITKEKRFIAIGQADAIGTNKLISVGAELDNIGEHMRGLAKFTRIEGPESSIARVTEELSKNDWVHFACHGIPNRRQPFESAFALHDGHFTIQQIIQCNLENPEFAYLSACHTTVGDEESPDEVIHLASAMQFAGFRSVIGTMWAVDDGETNRITSMFYENMRDECGRLDYTRAAFALNETMKRLDNVPFDQRILYIHLGA